MRVHFLNGRAPEVFHWESLGKVTVGCRGPKFGRFLMDSFHIFGFLMFSPAFGSSSPGIVPGTQVMLSNAMVAVLELIHGQILADFGRIYWPMIFAFFYYF